MPARLRPTAPIATEAILVGDPGRALLLAQELLEQPKMSNHARGLWGYSGATPEGRPLTIQSTGMGGPSAALVLGDLAELGVRRAVRVGTCVAFEPGFELGELLVVTEAIAAGGEPARSDDGLTARLDEALNGEARGVVVTSFDHHPAESAESGVEVGDMQSAQLFARAGALEVKVAALLIVAESRGREALAKEQLEAAEKIAGKAAAEGLLSP